jgi:hypothetical protein
VHPFAPRVSNKPKNLTTAAFPLSSLSAQYNASEVAEIFLGNEDNRPLKSAREAMLGSASSVPMQSERDVGGTGSVSAAYSLSSSSRPLFHKKEKIKTVDEPKRLSHTSSTPVAPAESESSSGETDACMEMLELEVTKTLAIDGVDGGVADI